MIGLQMSSAVADLQSDTTEYKDLQSAIKHSPLPFAANANHFMFESKNFRCGRKAIVSEVVG